VGLDASVVGWTNIAPRFDSVVSATGAKWMRQDFFWDKIEPTAGVFDFSYYDQFVLQAAQHGVHLLPLLFDVPSWAGANYDSIPADPSAYAAYVAAVVRRYGPHGTFWAQYPTLAGYAIQTFELWNEPYYDNGNDGNYDPARYARLVKAAGSAGHAADPNAKFLIAADNQAQLVGSTWVWWVDALYQAVPDLNNYFDGVAVHPYGNDLTNLSYPTPGQAYDGYSQIRRVESIRQEFVNHNAADKPLWITEIGWPTCTSGSTRCTSPAGQAANLQTVFNYARTTWKPYLQGLFIYSYDDALANSTNPEANYGLAYNDGTPKPALAIFKANEA
jgi:polysaccharide biosynthesis protein PslG